MQALLALEVGFLANTLKFLAQTLSEGNAVGDGFLQGGASAAPEKSEPRSSSGKVSQV